MLFNNTGSNAPENQHSDNTLLFGEFALDLDRGMLLHHDVEISLRPKSFKLLEYLVAHTGVLNCKDELMKAVWPDVVVTEDSLTQCLLDIRKALNDVNKDIVRTLPRRGYLFDLPVTRFEDHDKADEQMQRWKWISPKRPSLLSFVTAIAMIAVIGTGIWEAAPVLVTKQVPDQEISRSTAVQHYTRGMFYHGRRSEGDLDLAIAEFRKAVAIDPQYADAWAGMAGSVFVREFNSESADFGEDSEYKLLLNQAISIDPNNPSALIRLSDFYYCRHQFDQAQDYLDQALKYGPDVPLVLAIASRNLFKQGKYDEAINLQRHAVELEPLSVVQHGNLAHLLYRSGDFQEADAEFQVTIDLGRTPDLGTRLAMLNIDLLQQRFDEAGQQNDKLSDSLHKNMVQAIVDHAGGRFKDSNRELQNLQNNPDIEASLRLAEFYSYLNSPDQAFDQLLHFSERLALLENVDYSSYFLEEIQNSPFLKLLRDDPRWEKWHFDTEELVSETLKPALAANF